MYLWLYVAPFAGAWIEIFLCSCKFSSFTVAPFAGAWIEMFVKGDSTLRKETVAPFAGAWIEIQCMMAARAAGVGRSLRGSVD